MTDAILAIDPATHGLGFALVDLTAEPIVADYIPLDGEGAFERQIMRACERLPLDGIDVRCIVVEKVGGGRGVQSMLCVEAAGSACAGILLSRFRDATLFRPTPAAWRNAAGLKGNATKDALRAAAAFYAPELITDDARTDAAEALLMAYSEARTLNRAVGQEIDALRSDLTASEDAPKGLAPDQMRLP